MDPKDLLAAGESALAADDLVGALDHVLAAARAIAAAAPLHLREATLVVAEPPSYGLYEPRGSNVFQPGEPVRVYLEPAGLALDRIGERVFYGFELDVALKDTASGAVVAEQPAFGRWTFEAREEPLETFAAVEIELGDVPPGAYALSITVRDLVDEAARTEASIPLAVTD